MGAGSAKRNSSTWESPYPRNLATASKLASGVKGEAGHIFPGCHSNQDSVMHVHTSIPTSYLHPPHEETPPRKEKQIQRAWNLPAGMQMHQEGKGQLHFSISHTHCICYLVVKKKKDYLHFAMSCIKEIHDQQWQLNHPTDLEEKKRQLLCFNVVR